MGKLTDKVPRKEFSRPRALEGAHRPYPAPSSVAAGPQLLYGKLTLSVESLPQAHPFHVGHHVVEKPVCVARVVERKDVGMLKVRRGLDLREKALRPDDRRQLGFKTLRATRRSCFKSSAR